MNYKRFTLLVIGIMIVLSPVVIYEYRLRTILYPLLWIFVPIFLFSLLPKKKPILLKSLVVLTGFAYFLVSAFYVLGFALCSYGKSAITYQHVTNPYIKLVGRDYSCYGTTGNLILYKQFNIINGVAFEFYYKKFADYKNINIDTTTWKPVKSN